VTASKNIYSPNAPPSRTSRNSSPLRFSRSAPPRRKPLRRSPALPRPELSRDTPFGPPLAPGSRPRKVSILPPPASSVRQELVYSRAKGIYINQPCNLFLHFAKVWREYTRRPVRKYPAYAGLPNPLSLSPAHAPQDARHDPGSVPKRARVLCMYACTFARTHARFLDAVFHRRLFLADKRVAAEFLSFLFRNDENSPLRGCIRDTLPGICEFYARDYSVLFLRVPSRNGDVDV